MRVFEPNCLPAPLWAGVPILCLLALESHPRLTLAIVEFELAWRRMC
jgi:hypothetical protein